MNQRELELESVQIGKEYAERTHAEAEEKGRAASNPYASAIHRRFVEPLAKMLSLKYTNAPALRGRTGRIKVLMRGLDPKVTAYLATRSFLNNLVPEPDTKATSLALSLGTTVYGELLLREFEDMNPALFHVLTRDLKRRMSKDERHRMAVFRHESKKHGYDIPEWSRADKILVGTALIREAEQLDLLTRSPVAAKGVTVDYVDLHPAVRSLLDQIKEFVSLTVPLYMPCVERPRPWVSPNDGGWHTNEMRRVAPTCITSESFVESEDVPQSVLDQLTRLQDVGWRINKKLLEAVTTVARHFDVGDVLSQEEVPRPVKPMWLKDGMPKEDMDELQTQEFHEWKRRVAMWHTEKRARVTKWGRFYESMRVARKFAEVDKLHFVYQMDYRGRFYARTRGVNPQGSDLQKALLEFSRGGLISSSPESIRWFKINGANRYGYDKEELDDRAAWVDEHSEHILAIARDPISHRDWTEADKPFQFLAWCFEYAAWRAFPESARSHLAVGLDGSCNGLQHLSALSRDEVGGSATNLTPGKRRDIYEMVAEELAAILERAEPCEFRDMWRAHGITRKLTKRSVMTLPYGATRFSCADFIQTDYLKLGLAPEIPKDQYAHAATWLSYRLWEAIALVVVRGQRVQAWLQGAARAAIQAGNDEITWVTPQGLRVRQRYAAVRKLRLVSRLHGSTQITMHIKDYDEDRVDGRRHLQGIAPNFTHSLDAAHMQAVIARCGDLGLDSLAMIHDDYGTTCDRTEALYRTIRETFCEMYRENSPLDDLAVAYSVDPYDDYGALDPAAVLGSDHFFS